MAFAAYFAGKKGQRAAVATGVVSLGFSLMVALGPDCTVSLPLLTGLKLTVDGFRRVYIVIICFMWVQTLCCRRSISTTITMWAGITSSIF